MKYREDFWYIAGVVIALVSALVIAVTMIMMYYGNDKAIIWCFGAMPILAVGILTAQSTKRRYEEADATDGEPLPMFWRIRYGFHNTKIYLSTSRKWRRLYIALISLFTAVAVSLSGMCVYWLCKQNSLKNSAAYTDATARYEVYYTEWQQARQSGDEALREQAFAKMREANDITQEISAKIDRCKDDIKFTWPWIAVTGACAVFCGTMYYVYGVKKRENDA